jgi:hypothetical protein
MLSAFQAIYCCKCSCFQSILKRSSTKPSTSTRDPAEPAFVDPAEIAANREKWLQA